jgi:alpha-glucosidase
MRVIMDFVPNHTSDEHPWFLESRSSRDNQKRDWYIWRDGAPGGAPPTNWLSVFGGSAWSYDDKTGQYYMHSFLSRQPDLNWRNPEVKQEMIRILKFWLHRGVDGFRTDAVYHLMKDEKFRDDPPNPNYISGKDEPYDGLLHTYSTGQPELYKTANALCEVLGAHENTFMVSEAYLDIPGMEKLYEACANNLHAPMNFNLMSLPWSAAAHKTFIDAFELSLGEGDVPNYVLGNHDRSRIATRIGHARARLSALLIFALKGMPFIYYGEELGMEDAEIPGEKARDPWGKNVPGFKVGRDPERTPMQWTGGNHAGFTDGEPWLPVAQNHKAVNVEIESADPSSMLSFYRRLIHFRKNSLVLTHGTYQSYEEKNDNVFSFIRERFGEKILVTLNFSGEAETISCEGIGRGALIATTHMDRVAGGEVSLSRFQLRPYEGCMFSIS